MKASISTFIGLGIALFGPPLIALGWRSAMPAPATLAGSAPWLIGFLLLTGAVIAIARFGEGLGFRGIGFARSSSSSIAWGFVLALFLILVIGPATSWLAARLGGGFEAAESWMAGLPAWYLALTILVVAAGEEWLYRGYAIERLAVVAGSMPLAGLLSLLCFGLAHLPLWGIGVSLATLLPGAVATGLYIWRRDAAFLMLAHVLTDLYGLLIAPRGEFR